MLARAGHQLHHVLAHAGRDMDLAHRIDMGLQGINAHDRFHAGKGIGRPSALQDQPLLIARGVAYVQGEEEAIKLGPPAADRYRQIPQDSESPP